MMRFLPQRGPMLGEAACHFHAALRHLMLGRLCLDLADLDVDDHVGEVLDDVADLASDTTAAADEYAGEVAAQRAEVARKTNGGEISPPPARSPDPTKSPAPTISHRSRRHG